MDDAELIYALLTDPVFLAVAVGLLLVVTVVVVIVGRRLWRRARRFTGQNSHLIERARSELTLRTLPEGSPARRAAELRGRLTSTTTETDRVVAAADGQALVSAMLAEQHHELRRLSAALDRHLRELQRDPDGARVEAALPEAERWTEQLCDVAGEIRENVRASSVAHTGEEVRELGERTSDGAAAMRAGIEFLQTQVKRDPR